MPESAQPRRQATPREERLETMLDRLFDRLVTDLRAARRRMDADAASRQPRPRSG